MDNPKKLATFGHTRRKTNTNKTKITTQYLVDTTICKETQIAEIRYKSS